MYACHCYTGTGKGKTTAAIGLATRCLGHHWNVAFVSFLKSTPSGELTALEQLGATIFRAEQKSSKFTYEMSELELEQTKLLQQNLMKHIHMTAATFDCIVLDEVLDAISLNMFPEFMLLDFIQEHESHCEIICTGRNASTAVLALSAYHSEIQSKKHPFISGISAREGIEF